MWFIIWVANYKMQTQWLNLKFVCFPICLACHLSPWLVDSNLIFKTRSKKFSVLAAARCNRYRLQFVPMSVLFANSPNWILVGRSIGRFKVREHFGKAGWLKFNFFKSAIVFALTHFGDVLSLWRVWCGWHKLDWHRSLYGAVSSLKINWIRPNTG